MAPYRARERPRPITPHPTPRNVQIALSGNRIGVLTGAGDAYVKEGGLSAGWVHELGGVTELALS